MSLVRPLMEFGCPIWNPYRVGQAQDLEMVQRRAARFVMGRYQRDESVAQMIQSLQWHTLRSRRENLSMGLFEKFALLGNTNLVKGILKRNHRGGRKCHTNPLVELHAHSDPYYWSFFLHAIRRWNSLPKDSLKLIEIQFGDDVGAHPDTVVLAE